MPSLVAMPPVCVGLLVQPESPQGHGGQQKEQAGPYPAPGKQGLSRLSEATGLEARISAPQDAVLEQLQENPRHPLRDHPKLQVNSGQERQKPANRSLPEGHGSESREA